MTNPPPPSYRREFAKSPHHIWFGFATLGLGFLLAHPLPLLVGATAYALGWIYLPDMPFFRRWVDARHAKAKRAAALAQAQEFIGRRDVLIGSLSPSRRERYLGLAGVCRGIEAASADNPLATGDPATDPRLRKLDELMWTFLRLLSIEEALERFLETERRDDVPRLVRESEQEIAQLTAEVADLKSKKAAAADTKQRLLNSREERLDVLRKRLHRIQQAQENLTLVVAEQERLDQQIKLIRADAVATKNAEALTARIDATVEHLDQTNKWLSELDEFKDLVGGLPTGDIRVGFEPTMTTTTEPPPLRQPIRSAPQSIRVK